MKLIVKRTIAYKLDILILFLILAPTAYLVESVFKINPQTSSQIWMAAVMSFSIPSWTYFIICDLSRKGATIGKRIMKIRVIPAKDKNRINYSTAIIRTGMKLLPWEIVHVIGFALADVINPVLQNMGLIIANVLIIVYLVVLIFNRGEKTIHDLVSQTKVTFSSK